MARALACLGDKTSYGEVISATATWFEGNKVIARNCIRFQCAGDEGQLRMCDRNELRYCGGKSFNGKNCQRTEPVSAATFFT